MNTSTEQFDLKTARINAGYGIRGFARKVGVSEATLRSLEKGQNIRPESAKCVADFFGIKVTDLLRREDDSRRAA